MQSAQVGGWRNGVYVALYTMGDSCLLFSSLDHFLLISFDPCSSRCVGCTILEPSRVLGWRSRGEGSGIAYRQGGSYQ